MTRRVACFAVEGARAAHRLLCAEGVEEQRARRVAEAISLHLNVTVAPALGVEASLLSKGVSLDTVGRRVEAMPAPALTAVAARWPRENFTEWLVATSNHQAQIRPQSRSAFLSRLGFEGLLRGNPLDRG